MHDRNFGRPHLLEYALLIVLVLIVILAAFALLRPQVNNCFGCGHPTLPLSTPVPT